MSDTPTPETPAAARGGKPCRGRHRRRGLKLVLIGGLVALIGAGAYARYGDRHHGGLFALHGAVDPEKAAQRLDKGIERVLARVSATTEQKSKVSGILRGALKDLVPMRTEIAASRGKLAELLAAETIDRARLEQLRAEQAALFETASRRMAAAMAETAEVLTPAQRQALIARLEERRRGWSWRG